MKMRLTLLAASAVLAGCSSLGHTQGPSGKTPTTAAGSSSPAAVVAKVPDSPPLIGAFEPGVPSYAGITQFTSVTKVHPRVVLYYSSWGEPFQEGFAATAWNHGAYTFAQLEPGGTTLAKIAAGNSDPYLARLAAQVRAFRHPVLMSFAHEMNGTWYSWGKNHATPAQFIASWRHVVQAFRNAGARNVTWVWDVNDVNNAFSTPLSDWWPGGAWVDWAGVDGYFYLQSDTYANVLGSTITQIRMFTHDPVIIGETAVGPGPSAVTQVRQLMSAVTSDHLAGLIWFDEKQSRPPYHLDWRLADDSAAALAFRQGAQALGAVAR